MKKLQWSVITLKLGNIKMILKVTTASENLEEEKLYMLGKNENQNMSKFKQYECTPNWINTIVKCSKWRRWGNDQI